MKLLIAGDVEGRLSDLFSKVENVNQSKAGPFDILFCVGPFSCNDPNDTTLDNVMKRYIEDGVPIPIPTYFFDPGSSTVLLTKLAENHANIGSTGEIGEICSGMYYLGKGGIKQVGKLAVAFWGQGANAADMEAIKNVANMSAFQGVDLMLASDWAKGLDVATPDKLVEELKTNGVLMQAVGSTEVAELAVAVRPRYLFFGSEGAFFQRPPYRNVLENDDDGDDNAGEDGGTKRCHVTRCIALGKCFSGKVKREAKWLHALSLEPIPYMPKEQLWEQPAGTTDCPFVTRSISLKASSKRHAADSGNGGGANKRVKGSHDPIWAAKISEQEDGRRSDSGMFFWGGKGGKPGTGTNKGGNRTTGGAEANWGKPVDPNNRTVYVGQLAMKNVGRADLEKVFGTIGTLARVRCNVGDNYGFVVYETHEHAKTAISTLNGRDILGNRIVLSWGKNKTRELPPTTTTPTEGIPGDLAVATTVAGVRGAAVATASAATAGGESSKGETKRIAVPVDPNNKTVFIGGLYSPQAKSKSEDGSKAGGGGEGGGASNGGGGKEGGQVEGKGGDGESDDGNKGKGEKDSGNGAEAGTGDNEGGLLTKEVIRDAFITIGKCAPCDIVDVRVNPMKGFGFIDFISHEAARAAIDNMHRKPVLGHAITCNWGKAPSMPIIRHHNSNNGNTQAGGGGEKASGAPGQVGDADKNGQPAFPKDPRTECWFCLSSPDLQDHLLVSISNEVYLALPIGGMVDDHVLIIPITHATRYCNLSKEAMQEFEKYKSVVRQYYASKGSEMMCFERCVTTQGANHMHLQLLPLPRGEIAQGARAIFKSEARRLNMTLEEISVDTPLQEALKSDKSYFYAEIPGGKEGEIVRLVHWIDPANNMPAMTSSSSSSSTGNFSFSNSHQHHHHHHHHHHDSAANNNNYNMVRRGVPLQFGRSVAAKLLGMFERVHWKACKVDRVQEIKLAEKFRRGFKPFDFAQDC